MLKIIVLSSFIASLAVIANAEATSDSMLLRKAEDSLNILANQIPEPHADEARMQNHALFSDYLEEVLMYDNAFVYPFDSLRTVSMLHAPDSSFRIITWYVPLSGRRFHYSGLIQLPDDSLNTREIIRLHDSTPDIDRSEAGELTAEKWFGAFYYDIIHEPVMEHFILLGWKGDNPQTRMRVIEPLGLRENHPVFGKQVFDEPFRNAWRIVFEYSARVSMSLQYEDEILMTEAGNVPMIVFDRLVPTHGSLSGHYQFYKPEVHIVDGLYYDGQKWRFAADVDARLPETD